MYTHDISSARQYEYIIESNPCYGEIVTLISKGATGRPVISVSIAPKLGFNLFRWTVGGQELLEWDMEQLLCSGFYGTPILYPTPNRVKDARFDFEGEGYPQEKHGIPRLLHGLVYDEAWNFSQPVIGDDFVQLSGWVDFNEVSAGFASFPIPHRLTVTCRLLANRLELSYTVKNCSQHRLPFGFAIHPYFKILDDQVSVCVPADLVFESDSEHFPIRIIPVDNTRFDLRTKSLVKELDLDDVYTGLDGRPCFIYYPNQNITLRIETSSEFRHVVVYTPKGQNFFCIENQTCMTDAHNAYNRGMEKESGLLVLDASKERSGSIRFSIC